MSLTIYCSYSELFSLQPWSWSLWDILLGWKGLITLVLGVVSVACRRGGQAFLPIPQLCLVFWHILSATCRGTDCSPLPQFAAGQVKSICFASGKEGTSPVFQVGRLILLPGLTL